MTKLKYSYLVVEDDLEVCQDLKARMSVYDQWNCIGLISNYEEALHHVIEHKPNLLFLDYSIRGGNTFDLLEEIKTIENYTPFIIYFSGYASDNHFISEDVINKYKVNIFLNKPIQAKFTAQLPDFIVQAENWQKAHLLKELWIITENKINVKIDPHRIVCITQPENNPRFKTIRMDDDTLYDIKASWKDCEEIAISFNIDCCITKSRETMINKKYISKLQKPLVWLNNKMFVEVAKYKWKELGF